MTIRRQIFSIAGCVFWMQVALLHAGEPASAFRPLKTELMRGGDGAQAVCVDLNGAKDFSW